MFARTERLLLRPGWAEDAPALARAIADEAIVRNLATAPWPYGIDDARDKIAKDADTPLTDKMQDAVVDKATDAASQSARAWGAVMGRSPGSSARPTRPPGADR